MSTFIFIPSTAENDEGDTYTEYTDYPTDTPEQITLAQQWLNAVGLMQAKVYTGDPDGEHIPTGRILFAD